MFSHKGPLHIFVNNGLGAKFTIDGDDVLSSSKEQTKCFSYDVSLDIYNASNNTRIMRDIQIRFKSKNEIVKVNVPYDNDKTEGYPPQYYKVGVVNIPPKQAIRLNLHNYFWDEDGRFIWDVTSVELLYKIKRRIRIKKLEKVDYSKYTFNREEQYNGKTKDDV